MTSSQLDAWRRRPLEVRVLDRCNECATLQPDVRERINFWPNIRAVCCSNCFNRMLAEFNDLSYT